LCAHVYVPVGVHTSGFSPRVYTNEEVRVSAREATGSFATIPTIPTIAQIHVPGAGRLGGGCDGTAAAACGGGAVATSTAFAAGAAAAVGAAPWALRAELPPGVPRAAKRPRLGVVRAA